MELRWRQLEMSVRIGAPLVVDGPVYANGPVYVQGLDIKAELESLSLKLEKLDKSYADKLDRAVYFVIKNFKIKDEEKTVLEDTILASIKITDWASRIDFWVKMLKTINPFLSFVIQHLVLHGNI